MPKVLSLEIFPKIYFPKTSYEYFDSSWIKNRGKSCTPHSRVSKMCRLRLQSDHSPPWKWGLETHETWVSFALFVRPQGTRSLEGGATRRYLSPSREVAAAIPRSREGAATHAGVDRRWHAVCDTEGIDERHTGARLHGGTRDPRRGVTEGQSSVTASGNCSGTRGTSARHTGARAVFPGFKPLNLGTMSTLSVDVERVTLNGVTSSVRRSCPRPFSQKPRSNVPTAPQSGILSFSVSINT